MTYTVILLADFVITIVAGQCTNRTFIQTCVSCKSSSKCGSASGVDGGDVSYCRSVCLEKSHYGCNMVEIDPSSGSCMYFPMCTDVFVVEGFTTVRKTCTSDCLQVQVTTYSQQRGTCNILSSHNDITSVDKCLSLCLDTTYCRAATYSYTQTCDLHSCNTWKDGGNEFTYMQLKCAGETTTRRMTATETEQKTTRTRDTTSPTTAFTSTALKLLPISTIQPSSESLATAPSASQLPISTSPLPSQTVSNAKSVLVNSTNEIESPETSISPFTSRIIPSTLTNKTMKFMRTTPVKTLPFIPSMSAITPSRTVKVSTESLTASAIKMQTSMTSTVSIAPAFTTAIVTQLSVTSTLKASTTVASTYMSTTTYTPTTLTSSVFAKTFFPHSASSLDPVSAQTTVSIHQLSSDCAAFADYTEAPMSISDNGMTTTLKEDIENDMEFFGKTISIAVFSSIGGVIVVTGIGIGIWQLIIRKGTPLI